MFTSVYFVYKNKTVIYVKTIPYCTNWSLKVIKHNDSLLFTKSRSFLAPEGLAHRTQPWSSRRNRCFS